MESGMESGEDMNDTVKKRLQTMIWAFKLGLKINKRMFFLWFGLSGLLAVLPAVLLYYNKAVIGSLTAYVTAGTGSYDGILGNIIVMGVLMTVIGLSGRLNEDFLYVTMYDSYYIGLEDILMTHIQKIPLDVLWRKDVWDEFSAITVRGGALTDFLSSSCLFLSKFIGIISLLFTAMLVSKWIFLAAFLYVLLAVFYHARSAEKINEKNIEVRAYERKEQYFYQLPLTPGVAREIRTFDIADKISDYWKKEYLPIKKNQDEIVSSTEWSSFFTGGLFLVFSGAALIWAVFGVEKGILATDTFLMLYMLCQNFSNSIGGAVKGFLKSSYGLVSLERQKHFLEMPLEEEAAISKLEQHEDGDAAIEAINLSFAYPGGKTVLKNLNFRLYKGESIALVGKNGSGKSTLVNVLLGQVRPTSGQLLFFGRPYEEYRVEYLRKCMGVFFQNVYLFHASFADNVGVGRVEDIHDRERILTAVRKGGAETILSHLPKKLEQWLGKRVEKTGVELSGGEKQKVAISRTFMGEREITFFDEPASALDPLAEMEQFIKIREELKGRTAVLISHRIGFARLADKIMVMKDGELEEIGTHEELLKKDGEYRMLFSLQADLYDKVSGDETEVGA